MRIVAVLTYYILCAQQMYPKVCPLGLKIGYSCQMGVTLHSRVRGARLEVKPRLQNCISGQ